MVEKLLTNWLALCMYDYIESRAGSSLFLLYKAIKCQIEKGPVDQFTQESKYALSDEGLLRESCDYSVVTCLVVQRELEEAYQVSTVVPRFSALGPSPSKSALNRDSALNRIIPI